MEKLSLLESVLGKGKQTNRDYWQFNCPFHNGKNGPKLGVSLNNGNWKCWVCAAKGTNVPNLFFKLGSGKDKIKNAEGLWKNKLKVVYENHVQILTLPKEYIPLWEKSISFDRKRALKYCQDRGITIDDIFKHRIGYAESGEYNGYLIFPSFNDQNQLIFFYGRSFYPNKPKHKLPDVSKDIIASENLINWEEDLILCESKLNAITIKRNALEMYGKVPSKRLKRKIIESPLEKIYICLDGDADEDVYKVSEYFNNYGKKVFKVKLPPEEDANSVGFEKIWEYIGQAQPIKKTDEYDQLIKSKLK